MNVSSSGRSRRSGVVAAAVFASLIAAPAAHAYVIDFDYPFELNTVEPYVEEFGLRWGYQHLYLLGGLDGKAWIEEDGSGMVRIETATGKLFNADSVLVDSITSHVVSTPATHPSCDPALGYCQIPLSDTSPVEHDAVLFEGVRHNGTVVRRLLSTGFGSADFALGLDGLVSLTIITNGAATAPVFAACEDRVGDNIGPYELLDTVYCLKAGNGPWTFTAVLDSISVSDVPLPPAGFGLLAALGAIGVLGRSRRRPA
jgi:hypothetical protein